MNVRANVQQQKNLHFPQKQETQETQIEHPFLFGMLAVSTRPALRECFAPCAMYEALCIEQNIRCNSILRSQLSSLCVLCEREEHNDLHHHHHQTSSCATSSLDAVGNPSQQSLATSCSILDLSNNFVGPRGIIPLLQVIQKFNCVRTLVLDHSMLNSDVTVSMCDLLEASRHLRFLSMNSNPAIGPKGGRALLAFSKIHGCIERISLLETSVSPLLVEAIHTAVAVNVANSVSGSRFRPAPKTTCVVAVPAFLLARTPLKVVLDSCASDNGTKLHALRIFRGPTRVGAPKKYGIAITSVTIQKIQCLDLNANCFVKRPPH